MSLKESCAERLKVLRGQATREAVASKQGDNLGPALMGEGWSKPMSVKKAAGIMGIKPRKLGRTMQLRKQGVHRFSRQSYQFRLNVFPGLKSGGEVK